MVKRARPPSTVKVRNGCPTAASTTASQTQMLVATTTPSQAPSRSELCLRAIERPPGYGEPPSFCRSSVSTKATRVSASNGFVTKRSAPRATACPPTSIAPALLTPDIATIFTAGHSRRSRPIVCSPPCPGMKMSTITTSAARRSYARTPASPSAACRTSCPACSRCFVRDCLSVTSSSMIRTRAIGLVPRFALISPRWGSTRRASSQSLSHATREIHCGRGRAVAVFRLGKLLRHHRFFGGGVDRSAVRRGRVRGRGARHESPVARSLRHTDDRAFLRGAARLGDPQCALANDGRPGARAHPLWRRRGGVHGGGHPARVATKGVRPRARGLVVARRISVRRLRRLVDGGVLHRRRSALVPFRHLGDRAVPVVHRHSQCVGCGHVRRRPEIGGTGRAHDPPVAASERTAPRGAVSDLLRYDSQVG